MHVEAKRCTVGNFPDVETRVRNLKTGQHENDERENAAGEMTTDEKVAHGRTGHATYEPRCETCLKVRVVSTLPRKAVAEAAHFDYATVKNSQRGAVVKILVGAGPRGETFSRAVHRKGAKFERSGTVSEGAANTLWKHSSVLW